MNKKGFTLTELLATITVLAIIITISVASYNTIQKNVLDQQYENLKSYILSGAEDYAHKNNFAPVNEKEEIHIYINVEKLIKQGIITADDQSGNIINPVDKTIMNDKCIKIDYINESRSYEASFEENETNCQTTLPHIVRTKK